jgi:hypothetical protein
MILRVADDGIAGASEILFGGAGDGGIESGEDEVTIQGWLETFNNEIGCGSGDGFVEMPPHGFAVFPSGRPFGRGDFGEFKPGMAGEEVD